MVINIPTYVRLKVKKVKSIDFIASTATICATLLIDFNTKGLSKDKIAKYFYDEKKIKVFFNDEKSIILKESENVTMKQKKGMVSFTIRIITDCDMKTNSFNNPYEIL